jgi:hypothetical protein
VVFVLTFLGLSTLKGLVSNLTCQHPKDLTALNFLN